MMSMVSCLYNLIVVLFVKFVKTYFMNFVLTKFSPRIIVIVIKKHIHYFTTPADKGNINMDIRNAKYDIQILAQVAEMYYLEDMSQLEISKMLSCSRSMISVMLSEAKEKGLIEIKIKNPAGNVSELSDVLKKHFGLKNCVVVPTMATSLKILNRIVSSQAANLVKGYFRPHKSVGVAWGTTCYEFMHIFPASSMISNITVVPLVGGSASAAFEYQLNEMVRMFSEKTNGIPSFIYAPAYADSEEDKKLYMNSAGMKNIVNLWDHLDVAIVSIGAPPDYYINNDIENPYEVLQQYKDNPAKPVGDIIARRFNLNGEFLSSSFNNRLVAATPEQLTRIKDVFCIAAGRHKILSIIAGLRTGIINHFITDENTAKAVVSFLNDI